MFLRAKEGSASYQKKNASLSNHYRQPPIDG
jgi:hypothetical protein